MKFTSAELEDLRRQADIADIFGEAQDMVEDGAGLHPGPDCLEGVSADFAEAMWALHRREKRVRGKRMRDVGRDRSGPHGSRVKPKTEELRACEVCHYNFVVLRGGWNWATRRYCGNACRCKAYRIRRIMWKLGPNLTGQSRLPAVG